MPRLQSSYTFKKMALRIFFVLLFLTTQQHLCLSGVAYPYPISIKTAKGQVRITLYGDESCKYGITEDGYTIVQDIDGWYYACKGKEGNILKSAYRIEAPEYRSAELKDFLSKQEKRLRLPANQSVNKKNTISRKQKRPVTGNRKALVVLVQFPDVKLTKSIADFNNLFNQKNYSTDGATGSVADYYSFVSHGQLNLVCNVLGPYTAQHEMSYYGQNVGMGGADKNTFALFQETLSFVRSQTNLTEYDADEDGYVDNMHIIYAGYGEEAGASSDAIWAHEMTFSEIDLGNIRIDRYSCAPELRGRYGIGISRIGPHCHEIGHALGAMDYYDTNYQTNGSYLGTGNWDIMASGSWNDDGVNPANFNPYVRIYNFGWDDEIILTNSKDLTLAPSNEKNSLFRINTPVEDEFFLLENRRQVSFDKAVPGHGLLIFHIGSGLSAKKSDNTINATFPQECSIVCASSTFTTPTANPSSYGNINSSECPFPGSFQKNEFTANTTPSATCQDGTPAGFALTEIEESNETIHLCINIEQIETDDTNKYVTTGDTIWKDTFTHEFLCDDWRQEFVIGQGYWKIGKSIVGTSISSYAELGYPSDPWSNPKDIISTMLVSPEFKESDNHALLLSFNFSRSNVQTASLAICLRKQGNTEWQRLSEYSAPVGFWKETKIILEKQVNPFEIAFCGSVGSGGKVMLDNVVLQKVQIKDTAIPKNSFNNGSYSIKDGLLTFQSEAPQSICIYDLGGRIIHHCITSSKQFHLKSGTYIIRLKDNIQKVLIP